MCVCHGLSECLVAIISFGCATTSRSFFSRFFGFNSVFPVTKSSPWTLRLLSGDLATLTGGFRTYFLTAGWRGAFDEFQIFTSYFSCSPLSKMGIWRIQKMRKKVMISRRAHLACKSNSGESFWWYTSSYTHVVAGMSHSNIRTPRWTR